MLPFTLPRAIPVKISAFHPEQPNWDPNRQLTSLRELTSISERHFHKGVPLERKSSKQTLQKTCHVRVYAFSTHPMNSLHMPLSNPTINSTVLIDKIPQQNKTDRVIFVQPGKIVSTSVIFFFYLQPLIERIKTRIFVVFFVFCFLSTKKTQALECLISSLFLYLKLWKMTSGNLWLCVSAKPKKAAPI